MIVERLIVHISADSSNASGHCMLKEKSVFGEMCPFDLLDVITSRNSLFCSIFVKRCSRTSIYIRLEVVQRNEQNLIFISRPTCR